MEYMLLGDGSVKPFKTIQYIPEVRREMAAYGGVAYYWRDNEEWLVVYVNEKDSAGRVIVEPPDVIKLAAMLE